MYEQRFLSLCSGRSALRGVDSWMQDTKKHTHATNLQRITLQIAELTTEANSLFVRCHHSQENVDMILQFIRKCQLKDQDLTKWAEEAPENFRGKAVTWIYEAPGLDYFKAEVFPGRVDAFQDISSAHTWLMLQCSRLHLASMLGRALTWICFPNDFRTTTEYAGWSNTYTDIIRDMYAAIPYQLGWFGSRRELLVRAGFTDCCSSEGVEAKGLSGYLVSWALSCISTQEYLAPSLRLWAKGRLEYIASDLGMRYARVFIHVKPDVALNPGPLPVASTVLGCGASPCEWLQTVAETECT